MPCPSPRPPYARRQRHVIAQRFADTRRQSGSPAHYDEKFSRKKYPPTPIMLPKSLDLVKAIHCAVCIRSWYDGSNPALAAVASSSLKTFGAAPKKLSCSLQVRVRFWARLL